jgi:signal transduction histidine kinase
VIDAATQSLQRTAQIDRPNVLWRYDRIRRAVRRIDRLVDQFLSADQIDHIQGQLSVTVFDAANLLNEVVEASLCKAERFRLNAPGKVALIGDARQLQMALANLVDNAIKYSPAESPIDLSLKICPNSGQMGVEFVVANEGPPISELLHDKLFFRYTRGDDVANISGAGLGLYIVKRIVEAHQGEITCRPLQGGTAFHLWLPIRS